VDQHLQGKDELDGGAKRLVETDRMDAPRKIIKGAKLCREGTSINERVLGPWEKRDGRPERFSFK